MLSALLNTHAPLISKHSSHSTNPWFTSGSYMYLQAFKTLRRRLEYIYKRAMDPAMACIQSKSPHQPFTLKSATHRYHNYTHHYCQEEIVYSSLTHSSSINPRH